MAPQSKYYGLFFESLLNKEIAISTDALKLMLCTNLYVPSQDTHRYKSDVVNEVIGTGYVAGGVLCGSVVVSYDSPSNTTSFIAANGVWANSTLTARYAVLYDSTPATDAVRPLIGYVDFGADVATTTGTFSVVWDASGVGAVVVA